MEIIPAILAKDYKELSEKISQFINVASIVQLDICDGVFVNSKTWPYPPDINYEKIMAEEDGLPFWENIDFELDLMVSKAHLNFDKFLKLGPKRIIFHLEAEGEDFKEFLEAIDPYLRENIEIGIAINIETDIKKLDNFINLVDFVQFMGIEYIGKQGEPFCEKVLEKIKEFKSKYPELILALDGGVNKNNIKIITEVGVNRVASGSAFFDLNLIQYK